MPLLLGDGLVGEGRGGFVELEEEEDERSDDADGGLAELLFRG